MKVCKFGGSSVASAEGIRQVADIVRADPERRVVVVSAPGRRYENDAKVTDLLIAMAEAFLRDGDAKAELGVVVERYREIAADLGLSTDVAGGVADDLRARMEGETAHQNRFIDTVKAAGEDQCARLVARYLAAEGMDANYLSPEEAGLLVSDEYGNARVLPESYDRLRHLGERPGVTVFPGFFGHSPEGHIVTFPRGGSDVTGAILAAAVKAEVYENFTDVDSVFAANPAIVEAPASIPALTYREMRELSYAGFSVFHDEALDPVLRAGIPVCIKNTRRPEAPGTFILPERTRDKQTIVGIAGDRGFCSVFVSKYMMNREIGFGRRLLQIFEESGIGYEHTPSGIDNISVILREHSFTPEVERRVVKRIREELAADDVAVERDLAMIMVVGEGMQHTLGIACRSAGAFTRAGVNIEMINQGSSEVSMMYGVKGADLEAAVQALYDEFFPR